MTPTPADFRRIAIEVLIESIVFRGHGMPPQEWCDEFDRRNSEIPKWALDGKPAHERYVKYCRRECRELLCAGLRAWLTANDCPELTDRISDAVYSYENRDSRRSDWAEYSIYLTATTGA